MRSMSLVMSEQQKIDETVESITNKDKKKNTKMIHLLQHLRKNKFCCRE